MAVRPRFFVCVVLALSVALSGVSLAQDGAGSQAKSPAKQVSKKAPAKGTSKAKAKEAEPAVVTEAVQQEFGAFALAWMDKIDANAVCTPDRKEIVSRNGKYVARYNETERATMVAEVQTTTSAQTPYTGTIRYLENVYECEADSPEAAEKGPFVPVKSTPITEIFRYTNKKWLY
jgi:hypothetical protein